MTVLPLHSTHRYGLALTALLVVFGVAPDETQAACGDYLVIGGIDRMMDHSGDRSMADASQMMPADTPCHGPHCGQSPRTHFPPLPPQMNSSQDERAHVPQADGLDLRCPFWACAVETSLQLTAGFPFRLERPPRT